MHLALNRFITNEKSRLGYGPLTLEIANKAGVKIAAPQPHACVWAGIGRNPNANLDGRDPSRGQDRMALPMLPREHTPLAC